MRDLWFKALIGVFLLCVAPLAVQAATVEYTLTVARQTVTIAGQAANKITVNGTLPGPTLRFTEGDEAIIHVVNTMKEETSVHWHGLIVPPLMDGVPGFNHFAAIKPGETFTYRFPIRQAGTYWYHAHTSGQEQDGLYGAMVIAPKAPDPMKVDRDYVIVVSDYSQESPDAILRHLKMSSDYYQFHRRTVGDFAADLAQDGVAKTLKTSEAWGRMRMLQTDLSDVSGYRFLINGAPDWSGAFSGGQKVRLRFINAASMTLFDVRIPGLKMTVVAADGQPVEPVTVDEFRLGNAETYDVVVEPAADRAYAIAAESLDREGFALGKLTPQSGMIAPIPTHRPRAQLTMADMNMDQMMQDDPDMEMDMSVVSGWAASGAPPGAKVLNYGALKAADTVSDTRPATRDITVRLGGNMRRYIWTIDGHTFDPDDGIAIGYNERVRLIFVNETMMAHPIHLHGMFMRLDNGQPADKMPAKHTVIVAPGQSVAVVVTGDHPGSWPLHCHLLYHMATGMMTTLRVAEPGQDGQNLTHVSAPSHAEDSHDHASAAFHSMRLETDVGRYNGKNVSSWDLDGWIGGDDNKLWLKSKGEIMGSAVDKTEIWALYSRNVATFWDAQIGVRQDIDPGKHSFAALGVNGLAPYFFETEAHLFIRDDGIVSVRLRQENEVLLTNRLIAKPYAEINLAAGGDRDMDVGAGLSEFKIGVQLRYEIQREFAPYGDVAWDQTFGQTAEFYRQINQRTGGMMATAGIRWMF